MNIIKGHEVVGYCPECQGIIYLLNEFGTHALDETIRWFRCDNCNLMIREDNLEHPDSDIFGDE